MQIDRWRWRRRRRWKSKFFIYIPITFVWILSNWSSHTNEISPTHKNTNRHQQFQQLNKFISNFFLAKNDVKINKLETPIKQQQRQKRVNYYSWDRMFRRLLNYPFRIQISQILHHIFASHLVSFNLSIESKLNEFNFTHRKKLIPNPKLLLIFDEWEFAGAKLNLV